MAAAASLLIGVPSASAQNVVRLLQTGDTVQWAGENRAVGAITNTAVNNAGGWAALIATRVGPTGPLLNQVWGDAAGGSGSVLLTEDRAGLLKQVTFERSFGISNAGEVAVSAPITRSAHRPLKEKLGFLDSLWIGGTPVAVEGLNSGTPGGGTLWWTHLSRPGITAHGQPYWAGGLSSVAGGPTEQRGLFYGTTHTPLLLGGDQVLGLPAPLAEFDTVGAFGVSAAGQHWIAVARLEDDPTAGGGEGREAVVLNGEVLHVAGGLALTGEAVAAIGALPNERWRRFTEVGVAEGSQTPRAWFIVAETEGAPGAGIVVVRNGIVVQRRGETVDGEVLAGRVRHIAMNESGDLAYVWRTAHGELGEADALFLNGSLVLKQGQTVDLDGAPGGGGGERVTLTTFTGVNTVSLSGRDAAGVVSIYFIANFYPGEFDPSWIATWRTTGLFRVDVATNSPPVCTADWNDDGILDSADFFSFLDDYLAGTADYDGDGVTGSADFFAFTNDFFAGCN